MIAYLKGSLEGMGEDYVLVEVGGIGYQVKASARVIEGMPPLGSRIMIHTYTYVREDTLALYGFLTKDDLLMFRLLLGVNGVGPKGALGILSQLSAQELKIAILSQDAKTIAKAPGIGSKTAQRLLIDLKGKVSFEEAFDLSASGEAAQTSLGGQSEAGDRARSDAVEALAALGYSTVESLRAVQSVEIQENMDGEAILREALKKLF